jgi:hypothetical protein
MLHTYRLLTVAVLIGMLLVSSAIGASAKSLTPANQYGPVSVTVSTSCPTATTIVNLPIDPTQIQGIVVSGNVNGSINLFDNDGLINTDVTGSAPYSFTTTSSDVLQACVTNGGSGTVSFQGQLNMFSTNWAGYTVEGFNASPNVYDTVIGTWQVPSVICKGLLRVSDSATWVGLGGAPNTGSSKIEQIGTEQDCAGTIQKYYAVYENYPQGVVRIDSACSESTNSCNVPAIVKANDSIYAQVSYRDNGSFLLFEEDKTQRWHVRMFESQPGSADPSVRYSAECIEEFPQQTPVSGLANFQQVTFTNCSVDAYAILLGGPSIQQLTMKHQGGATMAQPSTLTSSGSSFSVSFVNS